MASCVTVDPYPEQPEVAEAAPDEDGIGFYGYTGDMMEKVVLPSGITVGKVGDRYLYADDIVLSEEQLRILSETGTRGNIDDDVLAGTRLWPNGQVPYVISYTKHTAAIHEAMDEYRAKTNITFFKKRNIDENYIDFVSIDAENIGGRSPVGMQGGRQELGLSSYNFITPRTVMHELGHALGLQHEHQRADRDTYITLSDSQRADPAYGIIGVSHGCFDFNSVTLYDGFLRYDGKRTIARSVLSGGDVDALHSLYGYEPHYNRIQPSIETAIPDYQFLSMSSIPIEITLSDPHYILRDHQDLNYDVYARRVDYTGTSVPHYYFTSKNKTQQITLPKGVYDIVPQVRTLFDETVEGEIQRIWVLNPDDVSVRIVPITQPPYEINQEIKFRIDRRAGYPLSGMDITIFNEDRATLVLNNSSVLTDMGDYLVFKWSLHGKISMTVTTPSGGFAKWLFELKPPRTFPGLTGDDVLPGISDVIKP